jgi:hypothetical protein
VCLNTTYQEEYLWVEASHTSNYGNYDLLDHSDCRQHIVGFLFGLHFNLVNGGDTLLKNIDGLSPNYSTLQHIRSYS